MSNRLVSVFLTAAVSAVASGFYFYGIGVDKTTLSYEKDIAAVKDRLREQYNRDVADLIEKADARLAKEKARQKRLKPVEKEIIRYVTQYKDTDTSQCVITDNGLRILSRYLSASDDTKN